MKTVDVLMKAKEIIQDPSNWMQGDYSNPERTCFCSLGAIAEALGLCDEHHSDQHIDQHPASKLLHKVVGADLDSVYTFAKYNDSHTHAEVMQAFDKAIELAKEQDI